MKQFKDYFKPGNLIYRECGKIEYIIFDSERQTLSLDIDEHTVYDITYIKDNFGKDYHSKKFDIYEIWSSKPESFSPFKLIWKREEPTQDFFEHLSDFLVDRLVKIEGVKPAIKILKDMGLTADTIVNILRFDKNDVEQVLEDEKIDYAFDLATKLTEKITHWIVKEKTIQDIITEHFAPFKISNLKVFTTQKSFDPDSPLLNIFFSIDELNTNVLFEIDTYESWKDGIDFELGIDTAGLVELSAAKNLEVKPALEIRHIFIWND